MEKSKKAQELLQLPIAEMVNRVYREGFYTKAPAECFSYLWDTDLISSLIDDDGNVHSAEILLSLAIDVTKSYDDSGDLVCVAYTFADGSMIVDYTLDNIVWWDIFTNCEDMSDHPEPPSRDPWTNPTLDGEYQDPYGRHPRDLM
jgi:hypothetical protein